MGVIEGHTAENGPLGFKSKHLNFSLDYVYMGATTSALFPFALWPFALVPFALLTICSIAHRSRRLLYMSSALYVN